MTYGWFRSAVVGLLFSISAAYAENPVETVFGKTFFGQLDAGVASTWFRGQHAQFTGKRIGVELEIDEEGFFEYRVGKEIFPGTVETGYFPDRLALYFEHNTHFPPNSFIPLGVSEDGSRLVGEYFVLGPQDEVPQGPNVYATLEGKLDPQTAKVWWKEVLWEKQPGTRVAQLILLEDGTFRYEVEGELVASGSYTAKELPRGRKGFRLAFNEPKNRVMNATFSPKEKIMSFNYGVRFTVKRQ